MTLDEYAQTYGLDTDTAMTHMALTSLVEAANSDEQSQRWIFGTLVQAIDPHKFAAALKAWAGELVAPAVAQSPEPGDLTEEHTLAGS